MSSDRTLVITCGVERMHEEHNYSGLSSLRPVQGLLLGTELGLLTWAGLVWLMKCLLM